MNVQRLLSLALSVGIALMGGAVVWAVGAQVTGGRGNGTGGLNEFVGVTPTPGVLPSTSDVATRLADVQKQAPKVGETLNVWLSGDAGRATARVRLESRSCGDVGTRGVNLCTAMGLGAGAMVDRYHPKQGVPGAEHSFESLESVIAQLLVGRHPRALFLAHNGVDAFMLGIGVDPSDPVDWVGGVDSGSAPTVAIYLTINAQGIVTDINDRTRNAPPLEPIRARLRAGESWVIDAAAPEFRDWEKEFHDSVERERKAP